MQPTSPITVPTVASVAATLERGARIAAPLICWAIAAVVTVAQIAYQLGHALGSAVHYRNDQLAAVARRLATTQPQAPRPIALQAPQAPRPIALQAPQAAAPAPLPHPLTALRDELSALTVAELRRITGTRRKARKADLVTMALAMA